MEKSIEKITEKKLEGYHFQDHNFQAAGEIMVKITLSEYRDLVITAALTNEKINDAERDKYKLRQEIESLKEENQTLRSALADKQITSSGDSSKEDGDE